ncbi:MAG: hypothetical protein F2534_03525 [Actinobacteria bacterium]|nr:hypothetical protein [Actinomycetota bacterium]
MARLRTGDFHKVYLVSAGSPPVNTILKHVVSTELSISSQAVNASSRDSDYELFISGKKDLSASITLNLDADDTQYLAFRNAQVTDTPIWLKFTTDAIAVNGTEVFEGAFMVGDIARSMQPSQTVQVSISLKLTPHATVVPGFSTVGVTP